MKILYVSKFDFPDYQNDMIFHGLRSLYDESVIDSSKAWYMYQGVTNLEQLYGKGFNLYGSLPNIKIDRSNLKKKIQNKYFDKVIYGSVWRCLDYLPDVIQYYNKENIVFIDGEDHNLINKKCYGKGIYYKRELLVQPNSNLKPISFCIPKSLISKQVPPKNKFFATILPGINSTYIFNSQLDYYYDYQKSYFALTTKKAGWDCLRHYEIIMNGCVPYFPNLENCPQFTMIHFPKNLILSSNKIIESGKFNHQWYDEVCHSLIDICREKLTTENMARYILH